MLKWLALPLWLFALVLQPWLMLAALALGLSVGWLSSRGRGMTPKVEAEEAGTADGRFPILNEDWVGEIVLAIDDAGVPENIRRHGARFRNPARYVIDLGHGEYLLYGGDGELLDICRLRP
ncbi:MAG: hypothetical protein N3C63_08605 [Rhodocyclaceae bacterium]|nr:hypothetical protein [Rhodocyclaceae bacterium]